MQKYRYNYSVIIPHFTRDGNLDMLRRAVNSIPERYDIQVIVVDNSLKPIPDDIFPDRKNVSIIYSPNSRKAGGARNEGMDHSNAKWYLFMDADDFFAKDAFDVFDTYLEAEFDIIFFASQGVYSDDINSKADRCDRYTSQVKRFLSTKEENGLRLQFQVPWAKMIRASLVEGRNIRFDEVPVCNDDIFSLKTGMYAKKIDACSTIVYYATVNKGSLTRTVSLESIRSHIDVYQRRNKFLKDTGYPKDASVAYYVVQSMRYGIKPFISLLSSTIRSGDLFVGSKNWINTVLRITSAEKRKENAKYRVLK